MLKPHVKCILPQTVWKRSDHIWSHRVFSVRMLCCTRFLVENTSALEVRVSAGASCLLCHSLQLDFSVIKEFSHVRFCKGLSHRQRWLDFFQFSQKNGQPGGVIAQTDVPSPVCSPHFLSGIQGGVCSFRQIPT